MSVIGDTQAVAVQPVVADEGLPITTAAKLADAEDAVNITLYSGKKMGTMYTYEVSTGVMEVVVAAGPAPDDKWTKLVGAGPALALTVAADVGNAAGITAQLNLIEAAINDGGSITPA